MGSSDRDLRSCCPIACTLDLVGDRWTLLVIRDLMLGKSRFDQFIASPEGIATNILARRLRLLVDQGLAIREPDSEDGRKVTYRLTERGESLRPVIKAIAAWGLESIEGASVPPEIRRRISIRGA